MAIFSCFQLLIFLVVTFTVICLSNTGRVVFEDEERTNRRRTRKRRPCRVGRTSSDGRTFFDINYETVNNNYYYICGGGQLSMDGHGTTTILQKPSGNMKPSQSGGGLFSGNHLNGGLLNGGGILSGILHDLNQDIVPPNDEVIVADEYDKPDSSSNPLVSVAEAVQSTVVGVTNAVTGTVQDVARPLIMSIQSSQQNKIFANNGNGFFFGLFDGSLLNGFFANGDVQQKPISDNKPVTEIYDDVEDPNQNYKPGLGQGIGNNPINGQYMIESGVNPKPSYLLKQFNRGIDNFVNPFIQLFY